ncbi:hypothetical protein QQF64_027174 [Cirrhinus molitorella]|uniref:Integrase catalytic domain-containing protein n=1 Tax=Cirrhinus molitorella TaxID=172907 RepID=A0ABR3NCE0_9TELE
MVRVLQVRVAMRESKAASRYGKSASGESWASERVTPPDAVVIPIDMLKNFLLKGETPETSTDRRKVRRSSTNFIIKDDRLFYVGPIIRDVKEWVRSCHRCQLNDPIKTVVPVLHSIKVKEPWEVLGLDLIGPLPETARKNKYVLSMTDLYTKWVIAEPMQSKTAAEVSAIITAKLYLFGKVRKIITDQGKEFVCKLNDSIFNMLKIKHAVASAYHPQTNGQDERTNQNIKRTLRKYVNDNHNDWDLHLPAVVYGINTAKQYSTRHSPYFLLFHRHPRLPEVMNACPMGDDFEVADPEDDIDTRVNKMKLLNETTDIPSIRKWRCLQILEELSIARHGQHFGQRFAFWTEEAEQLMAGTLPPIYRIPRPQIVKEEHVEVEELPLTLKHMYQAEYIVRNSPGLFTGKVQEPSYMMMDHNDQMKAWRVLMESTEWDAKEPFTFIFENIKDMETFMIICRDTLNLRVNAGCGVHSHPYAVY